MSQQHEVACRLDGGTASVVHVAAGLQTLQQLLAAVQLACPSVKEDWVFTDGQRALISDKDVQQLEPGHRLQALPPDMAFYTERVTFNPHPKTLTMAGDYEYFAAQGHHPLAFALSELIDNALSATKANGRGSNDVGALTSASGKQRKITVSLLTSSSNDSGLICVSDNGCGMSPRELNQWAVMNLSMEDRGLLQEDHGTVGNRYLSSNISYFGVGSKNAAFFLGNTVKVVTRQAGAAFVHELCIQGKELERRYREGAAVYEEDMVHRAPGAQLSCGPMEAAFPWAQQLLEQEASDGAASFTRVLVGDLRPEVLAQLQEEGATQLLRDLAHLYHYYLHGAKGNTFTNTHQEMFPNGEVVPTIQVQLLADEEQLWSMDLSEVEDDLESRYLKGQRNQMEFAVEVPGKGLVEGVLWYFPYQNDQETVPLDPHTLSRMQLATTHATQGPGGGVGGGDHLPMQQHGALPTQYAAAKDAQLLAPGAAHGVIKEAAAPFLQGAPIFEIFWQGRLIPGACVDTLPFIEAIRSKRTAAQKDLLPDEIFSRLRGALFFGPSFKVTRNKLTFRDNLPSLLAGAQTTERKLDKKFKDWLIECHTLDRTIRYELPLPEAEQAAVRQVYGEQVTLFDSITDGAQSVRRGNTIKLNCKPAMLGRVMFFSVPSAVTRDGSYSYGQVTITALPEAVFGVNNRHTWPVRRMEGLASEQEVQELEARELKKLPNRLLLEPLKLSGSAVLDLPAGSSLPESAVSVLSGSGHKVCRAFYDGQKQPLRVAQALYYLGDEPPSLQTQLASEVAACQASPVKKAAKSSKAAKRRKGARAAAAAAAGSGKATCKENARPPNEQVAAEEEPGSIQGQEAVTRIVLPDSAKALLLNENRTPIQDTYRFQKITGGLARSGYYCLRYAVLPEVPGIGSLYMDVIIHVAAGPPAAFQIQGAARAVAQARAFVLGECLPPLTLTFTDVASNVCQQTPDEGAIGMELLTASLAAGGTVLPDLQLAGEVVAEDGQLCVKGLQITAVDSVRSGLDFFCHRSGAQQPDAAAAGDGATSTGVLSQAPTAGPLAVSLVPTLEAHLAVMVAGMQSQSFPVRIRPGAPHQVQLLAGHPFTDQALQEEQLQATQLLPGPAHGCGLFAARVSTGDALPPFKVRVQDVWGNPTCPTEDLPFTVQVDCAGLQPSPAIFDVDCRGVAVVSGLVACAGEPAAAAVVERVVAASQELGRCYPVVVTPCCSPELLATAAQDSVEGMAAALVVAGQVQPLELSLSVQPSTLPATLVVVYQGEALPEKPAGEGAEEGSTTWLLQGVTAGSRASGLALRCLDEVGRPAATPIKGRVQVSWAKGSKKVHLGPQDVQVPPVPVPESCSQPASLWLRFTGDPKEWPDVCLEVSVEVHPAPGPPASWGMSLLAFDPEQQAGPAPDQPQVEHAVQCGVPFYLQLEALDACHNRCRLSPEQLLVPELVAEPLDLEAGPLLVDPASWNYRWDHSQAGGDVCLYKLCLAGPAGPVKLMLRDAAGDEGASLLVPDELELQLLAGPAATLVLTGPTPQLQTSSHSALPSLGVSVADDWGNTVESAVFEVLLQTSALSAADESAPAAKVSATGSNRVKLRNGVASFRGVKVAADTPGPYLLRVEPLSRKVNVRQGTLLVQLVQHNLVMELEIQPNSLPADDQAPVGQVITPRVMVTTEDGQPLPWEVVSSSLSLILTMPNPSSACSSSSKAKVRRADIIPLTPDRLASQAAAAAGVSGHVLQGAEGQQPVKGCIVCFTTPHLTLAGSYTMAAEYREGRDDLLPHLGKQEMCVRSPSIVLDLLPGQPAAATPEGPSSAVTSLTVSNGASDDDRCLLRQVSVQVRDSHSNPCTTPGIKLRWLLTPQAEEGLHCSQEEVPQMACSNSSAAEGVTDAAGRSFFGDLLLQQGVGRLAAGRPALRCCLSLQVALPRAPGAGGSSKRKTSSSGGSGVWTTTWTCDVVFSDDNTRVKQLQDLSSRCQQLQQQLDALKADHTAAEQRLRVTEQAAGTAASAARRELQCCEALLGPVLRQLQLDPELPHCSSELQQVLEKVQQEADSLPARQRQPCKFGASTSGMARALQRCVDSGDPEVVGVLAQLATVQDQELSALLAATLGARLQTLVVDTFDTTRRLKEMLQSAGLLVPNMLPCKLIQAFRPETEGPPINMRKVPKYAQQLLLEASKGTDPPLPLVLPHSRILRGGKAPACEVAADYWPLGLLGYAVNLVRPSMRGMRASILHSQLGRTLVFETLQQGAAYRQLVTQQLRGSVPDVVSLDGGRLAASGMVAGSGFQVVPLQQAACCFGSGEAGAGEDGAADVSALQAAIAALQQEEAAAAEVAEAQHALQLLQDHPCQLEAPQLEQQLRELQQQRQQLEQALTNVGSAARVRQGSEDIADGCAPPPSAPAASPQEQPALAAPDGRRPNKKKRHG